ncbi:MAG: hypothetical protein JWP57_4360, partial [Spirosoma sp.]|nr:hypothetical protein [Spirosoma sp.]
MANFDFTPTPVPLNPLFTGLGIDEGINKVRAGELSNQSAQQDLVDRATIRAQAEGLASGDRSAIARLATLPKAGGTLSVHGMSEYDTAAREIQNQNALLGLAGGLAARDPATMARAALLGKSGVAAVNALGTMDHNAATTALARLKADREQVFWGDEDGAGPGIPQGLATPLGGAESGNDDTRVNGDGYSGRFQFGAARLASPALGFYKPAPGENLKTNEWRGTFDIPGFPEIKTHEDFLRSPRAKEAQRAVFGVHVRDIDQTIANTPGAEGLDVNGLRAVAHLGGSAGMQEFVRTGGKYDPQDRNGTHLSDYYRRFASGGTPALVRAFGAPQEGGGAPAAPAAGGAPGGMATPVAASGGDAGMATPAAGADSAPAGP